MGRKGENVNKNKESGSIGFVFILFSTLLIAGAISVYGVFLALNVYHAAMLASIFLFLILNVLAIGGIIKELRDSHIGLLHRMQTTEDRVLKTLRRVEDELNRATSKSKCCEANTDLVRVVEDAVNGIAGRK